MAVVYEYNYFVSEHYTPACVYLKHGVLETGFCIRLQVGPIQLSPVDRTSPYLRIPAPT
jgi:hypothetical protein